MPAKKPIAKKVRTTVRKVAAKNPRAEMSTSGKTVKASTKKPVAKKAAPKKSVSKKKSSAKKTKGKPSLLRAPEDKCFWVNEGPVLADLRDLHAALLTMNNDQFFYHVHDEINHFADWVEWVLADASCAKALHKAGPNKKKAAKVVSTHLKHYQ